MNNEEATKYWNEKVSLLFERAKELLNDKEIYHVGCDDWNAVYVGNFLAIQGKYGREFEEAELLLLENVTYVPVNDSGSVYLDLRGNWPEEWTFTQLESEGFLEGRDMWLDRG